MERNPAPSICQKQNPKKNKLHHLRKRGKMQSAFSPRFDLARLVCGVLDGSKALHPARAKALIAAHLSAMDSV